MKSITQAAEILGVCRRRVSELCAEGRIAGAKKLDPAKRNSPWVFSGEITVLPAGRIRPGKIKMKG